MALSLSAPARAGDAAAAEALFRDGRTLMDRGEYTAACPKLRESYAQDAATGTLLALAVCLDRAGLSASAWATYSDVATRAKNEGQREREHAARERMSELEALLARLTIQVDEAAARLPGFTVTRNGIAVGASAWGMSLPVDPGKHVVEAKAPGYETLRLELQVKPESRLETLHIPPLIALEAANRAETAALSRDPSALPSQEVAPMRIAAWAVGGVGVGALGVAGYFALRARNLHAQSNQDGHCQIVNGAKDPCDAIGGPLRTDAISAANVATVSLILGGVLTGLGVGLWALTPSKPSGSAAQVEALPVVESDRAALFLRGRF